MRRHAWNCDLSTKPGTDILANSHICFNLYIIYININIIYMILYIIYIINTLWIQTVSEKVRLTLQIIVNYTPVPRPFRRYGWIHRDIIFIFIWYIYIYIIYVIYITWVSYEYITYRWSMLSILSMLSMLSLLLYGSLYKYNIDLYIYYHILIVILLLLLSNPGFYIILYIN